MNTKQVVATDWVAPYVHEVKLKSGTTLQRGMLVSVHRRPNLIGGRWVFCYAEELGGEMRFHVEGPISRPARHRLIHEADIKTVHGKSRRGD